MSQLIARQQLAETESDLNSGAILSQIIPIQFVAGASGGI